MKKLVFTTILLLLLLSAHAQLPELSAPKVLPESPAAAALTKHIECPVDLSNGLVQISIPLYETNPNQRKGQIHYQDDSGKYLYDSQKNNNLLKDNEVRKSINKGLKYIGDDNYLY